MTINEAIEHADAQAYKCHGTECGNEHAELARWLRELRARRETGGTCGTSDLADVLGVWVPVSVALPDKDVWVQVFEDDNDNPQDAFIGGLTKTFRQRVTPAKLLSIDSEGYADWYLCFVGSGPAKHVRNVTHWQPMAEAPNAEVSGGGAFPPSA